MTNPIRRARNSVAALLAACGFALSPLAAQVEQVDPDAVFDQPIDGDIEESPGDAPVYADPQPAQPTISYSDYSAAPPQAAEGTAAPEWSEPGEGMPSTSQSQSTTYGEDDLIGAAQGAFGDGAKGIATAIQKLLKEQGEPNAYIVGREAGGAFIVGARYGSGTLFHKIEGERPVYWTGPSIGFDAGANAGSTFVLVYNLYDSEELYERYPSGEGQLYAVGGVTASYLRKGDVVLIPIRVGAGLRAGINAGYMKFSKKQRWLPF